MTARWLDVGAGPSPAHVLSKTSAAILIARSPLHAHLRKAGQAEPEGESEREAKDRGNVLHAMLLGRGKGYAVAEYTGEQTADEQLERLVERFEDGEPVYEEPAPPAPKGRKPRARKPRARKPPEPPPGGEFQNWLRGDAKAARDAIRARGLIPLLPKQARIYEAQAKRLRANIEAMGFAFDGVSEPGASWFERTTDGTEEEVECMGALDHWRPRHRQILDLKIWRTAHPDSIRKAIYTDGLDIQAAAYTSAVEQIHPELQGRTRFVFLFCELYSGAVTPVELAGDFRALGRQRWQRAVNTWARCLREDRWPGYVEGPITVSAPEWAQAAEMAAQVETNDLARYVTTKPVEPAGEDAGDDEEENGDERLEDIF